MKNSAANGETYETCPDCDGTGSVRVEDERGEARMVTCPRCEGAGSVARAPESRRTDGGRKALPARSKIKPPPRPPAKGGGHSIGSAMPKPLHPETPPREWPEPTPFPDTRRNEALMRHIDESPPPIDPTVPEDDSDLYRPVQDPTSETPDIPPEAPPDLEFHLSIAESAEEERVAPVIDVSVPGELGRDLSLDLGTQPPALQPGQDFAIDAPGELDPFLNVGPEPPLADYASGLPPLAPSDPFLTPDWQFGLDAFDDSDDFDPFGGDPTSGDPFAGW